jgi:acid phosphatase class B
MEKITKVQVKEFVKTKLSTDPVWAKRALVRIFEFQTLDEQKSRYTKYSNGVGFSGADGEFLSSLAIQLQKKGYLSPKQMEHLYKKIPKYWAQVIKISDKDSLNKMVAQ